MEEDVNQQRLKDYQARMTSWIGRQGLFFQIRYLRLSGAGTLFTRLVSLLISFLIVLAVMLLISFGALKAYLGSKPYQESLNERVAGALGAESFEVKGFRSTGGKASYQVFKLEGGEESFFEKMSLADLEGPLPLFAGVWQDWSPESISLRKVEVRLQAGGEQPEMEKAVQRVIMSLGNDSLTRIRAENFNCEWGYSKLTYGGVYGCAFDALWSEGQWEVSLRGGYFRQNWLGPMAIEEAKFIVDEDGVEVESLSLSKEGGTLTLSGRIGPPLSDPQFDLEGSFQAIPVEELFDVPEVPEKRFLEGPISGRLEVSGSTNQHIKMTGRVELGAGDELRIRDEWRLLKAISAVSRDGNYNRIGFGEGSFQFQTGDGILEVSEIDLLSEKKAKLTGAFATRLIDQQEAADYLDISLTTGFSKSLTDTTSAKVLEDARMSLKRAAKEDEEGFSVRLEMAEDSEEYLERDFGIKELDGTRIKREMARPRYDGRLRLGLPEDLLSLNEKVAQTYPTDDEGWMWIPIELDSLVFPAISREEGEKLLELGQAYQAGAETSGEE